MKWVLIFLTLMVFVLVSCVGPTGPSILKRKSDLELERDREECIQAVKDNILARKMTVDECMATKGLLGYGKQKKLKPENKVAQKEG